MFRLASFVSFVLAGLRRENQISYWVSDQDETLDSENKREGLARLASYLMFGLSGWREPADNIFGATGSPMAPYWSEDLLAIADLVAGVYCKLSSFLPAYKGKENWLDILDPVSIEDRRVRLIGDWLAHSRGCLKHILLRLEQDSDGNVRSSAQVFAK